MARSALPLAVLAALAPLFMTSCVSLGTYRKAYNQLENAEKALTAAQKRLLALQEEQALLRRDLDEAREKVGMADELRERKEELAKLLEKVRKGLALPGQLAEDPDIETYQGEEGTVISIKGEVLFAPGQAELAEAGQDALKRVAEVIRDEPGQVRIAGHTDIDPIRKSKWRSNTELSVQRALEVAEFLALHRVPRQKLEVAGYGEFRPRIAEDTDSAKAKNRRVEIILLRKP